MKKWLLIFALPSFLAAGCSSFEEVAEPSGVQPMLHEASVAAPEEEVNPFSLEVMRRAVADVASETARLRRARGRAAAPEVADEPLEATHRYVHFCPANRWQLDALLDRRDFQCFNFRLDQPGELPEGETFVSSTPSETPDELYAVLRADVALPDTIAWEVLEEYYDPQATARGTSDEEWAEAVESRARTLSNSVIGTGDWGAGLPWTPSGRIEAWDDLADYIPIEGVKVTIIPPLSAGGNLRMWTVYTDRNGAFRAPQQVEAGGKVTYSLSWDSDDWTMKSGAMSSAILRSDAISGAWNIRINKGDVVLGPATVFRAAYRYWYKMPNYGLSAPKFDRKVRFLCHDDDIVHYEAAGKHHTAAGLFRPSVKSDNDPDIELACKRIVSRFFGTVSHEIGHAAHCSSNAKAFNKTTALVKESWAEFTNFIVTEFEYNDLGVELHRDSVTNDNQHMVDYVIPDDYNKQNWFLRQDLESIRLYTPMFIDLYDYFNQYEWYSTYYLQLHRRLEDVAMTPNDCLWGFSIADIEYIAFHSRNKSDVLGHVRRYALQRSFTNEDVDRYWEVYSKIAKESYDRY
ncbi:MAG: hypothetical protein K2H81_03500 [Alistipes sp.]|nr:hypothetical protein [Alistipes sp.]